jgi:DNA-binding beta-propeller fold protein YncE
MRRTFVGGLAGAVLATLLGGGLVAATLANRFAAPEPPSFHSLPVRTGPYTHRLYVLDIRRAGRVVAVQPQGVSPQLNRSYPVGVQAQTTLSPDGSRLYALSFPPHGDRQTMSTFDTGSGRLIHEAPIERLLPPGWGTEQYKIWPWNDGLVSSPEGGRLYFTGRSYTKHQAHDSIWLATYDTVAQRVLPEAARIPGCDLRSIVPQDQGRVVVVCSRTTGCCYEAYSETNDVRFLTIANDGSAAESDSIPLKPPERYDSSADGSGELAWAVPSPDGRRIYAVTRIGRLFVIDVRDQTVDRVVDLDLVGSFEVTGQKVALSRDGGTLYVGTSDTDEVTRGVAGHIQSFDVSTWSRTGGVLARQPFFSLALGPGGDYLYAVSPKSFSNAGRSRRPSAIQVFDGDTLSAVGVVPGNWHWPVLAEVPLLDDE